MLLKWQWTLHAEKNAVRLENGVVVAVVATMDIEAGTLSYGVGYWNFMLRTYILSAELEAAMRHYVTEYCDACE